MIGPTMYYILPMRQNRPSFLEFPKFNKAVFVSP